jgi:hypothetical protein
MDETAVVNVHADFQIFLKKLRENLPRLTKTAPLGLFP